MRFFPLIVPLIFLFSLLFAWIKKVKIYDSFTDGVKDAFPLVLSVFPYLATVSMLSKLFEVSGLEDKTVEFLSPVFSFFSLPKELIRLLLIKPLSGSGATAVLSDILSRYGVDSYVGRCACVLFGSSETVFYVGAVYFSSCKKGRHVGALLIALFSYFCSAVLCCALCKIM